MDLIIDYVGNMFSATNIRPENCSKQAKLERESTQPPAAAAANARPFAPIVANIMLHRNYSKKYRMIKTVTGAEVKKSKPRVQQPKVRCSCSPAYSNSRRRGGQGFKCRYHRSLDVALHSKKTELACSSTPPPLTPFAIDTGKRSARKAHDTTAASPWDNYLRRKNQPLGLSRFCG